MSPGAHVKTTLAAGPHQGPAAVFLAQNRRGGRARIRRRRAGFSLVKRYKNLPETGRKTVAAMWRFADLRNKNANFHARFR